MLTMLIERNDGSYESFNGGDVLQLIVWHGDRSLPVAMIDSCGAVYSPPSREDMREYCRVRVPRVVPLNPPRCKYDLGTMVLDAHRFGKDEDYLKWVCPICGHIERRYEKK